MLTLPERQLDLIMLPCFNSHERDLAEWTQLIKDADKRFQLIGAKQPVGSALGILEIEWRP